MQCVWIHCLPISNGAYCLMRQFSFVLCCFTKRSALSLADLAERPTSLGRVWDTILAIKAQHSCVWGYEKASSAATTSVSNAKSSSKINLQSFLFPSDLADGTEAAADSVCSAVVADDGGETAPWTQDWGGEEEGEGGRDLEAMLYRLWNVGPGKQVLELTTCTLAKREKCHCFFFPTRHSFCHSFCHTSHGLLTRESESADPVRFPAKRDTRPDLDADPDSYALDESPNLPI